VVEGTGDATINIVFVFVYGTAIENLWLEAALKDTPPDESFCGEFTPVAWYAFPLLSLH
jgi:hypothetical protein